MLKMLPNSGLIDRRKFKMVPQAVAIASMRPYAIASSHRLEGLKENPALNRPASHPGDRKRHVVREWLCREVQCGRRPA